MARVSRRQPKDRKNRREEPYVRGCRDFVRFGEARPPYREGTPEAAEYARGIATARDGGVFSPATEDPFGWWAEGRARKRAPNPRARRT